MNKRQVRALVTLSSLMAVFYIVGTLPEETRLIVLVALVLIAIGVWK